MTTNDLAFIDVTDAIYYLLEDTVHAGQTITPAFNIPADPYGNIDSDAIPLILITLQSGTQGHIDRVDRISLTCYAQGATALPVLQSVTASLIGTGINTTAGYLDQIKIDQTPHQIPYASATLNAAEAWLTITTRPL